MSIVFEEQYALEWCVNETQDHWEVEEEFGDLDEAKQSLEWNRKRYPGVKHRIAFRYVSEWKPLEGEA